MDIPTDFSFSTFADHVVVHCKSEWAVPGTDLVFPSGSVVAHPARSFLEGSRDDFTTLYSPPTSGARTAEARRRRITWCCTRWRIW